MEDRLLEYLDAAEAALVQFGPDAAEGMLLWARIDALSGLVYGVFAAIILALIFTKWREFHKWAKEDWWDRDFLFAFGTVGAFITSVISTIVVFGGLFNVWRWVGVFSPEMWLVHKAVSAIS